VSGPRVSDDELQAADQAGVISAAWRVADRASRTRRELGDVHVLIGRVVVELEADLVAIEGDRRVDVADGQDHDFQGPVHGNPPRVVRSYRAARIDLGRTPSVGDYHPLVLDAHRIGDPK
jgi:hypothetical protein